MPTPPCSAPRLPSIRLPACLPANPKLRWEKVEAWEAGAEANFLRNRLHFEGVYYKKKTKDLLAEVPGISGTYRVSETLAPSRIRA